MALVPSTSVGGSSSAGAVTQVYDNVAAGAIASWDVTGIAQTYTHLQVVLHGRGDQAAAAVAVQIRFNGDTGANYYAQEASGSAAVAGASELLGQTSGKITVVAAASAAAGLAGTASLIVPNYASATLVKPVGVLGGRTQGLTTGLVSVQSELTVWNSTAAITQVTIFPLTGNFVLGSRLTIYGLT